MPLKKSSELRQQEHVNSRQFHIKFNGTAGCDFNLIGGVSPLYPVQFTGTDIDWGYDGSFDGTPAIGLKNIDYQTAATIGGTENTVVRLYGDCEFDALTVNAGFTLDIDGHALTCSGQMTGASGTSVFADTAGNGIISCQALNQSNTSSMSNSHLILTGTGTTDVQSPFKNVLYNIGSSTVNLKMALYLVSDSKKMTTSCGFQFFSLIFMTFLGTFLPKILRICSSSNPLILFHLPSTKTLNRYGGPL